MDEQKAPDLTPEQVEAERKQKKLAAILERVDRGDTSVVSEVYWLQNFGEDAGLK